MNDPKLAGMKAQALIFDEVRTPGARMLATARELLGLEEAMQTSLERLDDVHSMNRAEIRRAVIGGKKIRGRRKSRGRILHKGNAKAVAKRHALRLVAKQARKANRA